MIKMQSESIACLMRAVSPVEHLAWFIGFSIITSYVSAFVSCSLVNGQNNLSIKRWGFFCSFPQKLPRFLYFFSSFLQTDVQKILRNARKLPEKTQTFYKVSNIPGWPKFDL